MSALDSPPPQEEYDGRPDPRPGCKVCVVSLPGAADPLMGYQPGEAYSDIIRRDENFSVAVACALDADDFQSGALYSQRLTEYAQGKQFLVVLTNMDGSIGPTQKREVPQLFERDGEAPRPDVPTPDLSASLKLAMTHREFKTWCQHGLDEGIFGTSTKEGPMPTVEILEHRCKQLLLGAPRTDVLSAKLAGYGSTSACIDGRGGLHVSARDLRATVPELPPGEAWMAVSAGYSHAVALTTGGALRAWGSAEDDEGECAEQPGLPPGEAWAAVAAGWHSTVGLTTRGALRSWGFDAYGQCSKTPSLSPGEAWVAIAGGGAHTVGLTTRGELRAWGRDEEGQCSQQPSLSPGEAWAAFDAGGLHTVGLTTRGALRAWGNDDDGQCSKQPRLPPGEAWVAVAAGGYHTVGLTAGGSLHAWGGDGHGQCSKQPSLPPGEAWAAVSAGRSHTLGLTTRGALRAWGRDEDGQCSQLPERWS